MRERVELATNKVTFWGTQNDDIEVQSEDVTHCSSSPANAQKISYKNWNYWVLKKLKCQLLSVKYNCTWSPKSVNCNGLPGLSLFVLQFVFNYTIFNVFNTAVINCCVFNQLQQNIAFWPTPRSACFRSPSYTTVTPHHQPNNTTSNYKILYRITTSKLHTRTPPKLSSLK
jgi:hypothetical protein